MKSQKICLFQPVDDARLGGVLDHNKSVWLKSDFRRKVHGKLAHEPLEWQFCDQKRSVLLQPSNVAQCDCSRAKPARFAWFRGHLFVRRGERFPPSNNAFAGTTTKFLFRSCHLERDNVVVNSKTVVEVCGGERCGGK